MTLKLTIALQALAGDPWAPLDLAEVALLLARDEFPNLDVEAYLSELNAISHEAPPRRGHLAHQVQALCRYLFHDMGFRGNQRNYYDPRNSYFNLVLERRTGIPITLSAVTMAIGQRAGLNLVGVGLPGHFIVKAIDDSQEVLIDPFHGGRILSLGDCENLVHQTTGVAFEATALALQPMPLGLIVQRMLGNLKAIYLQAEDWPRCIRTLERLRVLMPEDVVLRRDLGICLLRHGQPGKAIGHLRSYVGKVPEAGDVKQVEQLLRDAIKLVARWN
jgi:regulator of sirC expression with transglutaminase-like and TPR domain